MGFIARLFASTDKTADRVEAAGERIAVAHEQMADAWEKAAGAVTERLGTVEPPKAITNGRQRVSK